MNENTNSPIENEKPSEYAERLGNVYSYMTAQNDKKCKGQFFTPIQIARFMADLAYCPESSNIRILDPGCGSAILSQREDVGFPRGKRVRLYQDRL